MLCNIGKENKKRERSEEIKNLLTYLFFKYGSPVLLLTPTIILLGLSQGLPLFGVLLLKK